MTTRFSILMALCLTLGIAGCGDDAGGDGDGSPSSTSSAGGGGQGGGQGGGSSSGGMGGAGATGGQAQGGGGAGATGGSTGDPTVEWSVTPDTMKAGATIQATVTVTNFVLEPPGGPLEDGHGHFHIYLDNATGTSYLVADQVPMVDVEIPAETSAGPH